MRSLKSIKNQVYLFVMLSIAHSDFESSPNQKKRKPHGGQSQYIYIMNCCLINLTVFELSSVSTVNRLIPNPTTPPWSLYLNHPILLEALLSELGGLIPTSLVCFFFLNLSLCSNEQSILTSRDIILIAAFYPRLKHTELQKP